MLGSGAAMAQAFVAATATTSAHTVTVGDRVNIFLDVQSKPAFANVQWAMIPDSLQHLEILERGRIDTVRKGEVVFYKQRIVVTGFDSGQYYFPALQFTVLPKSGTPYTLNTDSIAVLVQTVAVDTTKDFKPIKGIIYVNSTWRDYLWLIIGGSIFLFLIGFVLVYFLRSKRVQAPVAAPLNTETLQEKAMKMLNALEAEKLWQQGNIKEYYVRLTEIVRGYIEARFNTPALELTTDALIDKAKMEKDLIPIARPLEAILQTADLAKFAKAQPTPQEHIDAMQFSKDIIAATKPVIADTPTTTTTA